MIPVNIGLLFCQGTLNVFCAVVDIKNGEKKLFSLCRELKPFDWVLFNLKAKGILKIDVALTGPVVKHLIDD
jgi:hypothetical protein